MNSPNEIRHSRSADTEIEFLSTGIDWLTCTMNDRSNCIAASAQAASLLKSEDARGCKKTPWGMSGYSGWKAGSIQFGRRDDELIVRLGSHIAHYHWRKFYEMANHVSRLDLECTTRTLEPADKRIRRAFKQAARAAAKRKRAPFVGYFKGNDGGATLYLRKRVSDRFGRIYEKGVESGQAYFLNAVRYELELKGDLAGMVAFDLSRTKSETAEVCSRVGRFVSDCGVALPRSWDCAIHSGCPRSRSDRAKTLTWLEKSVRPSLMAIVRDGSIQEAIDALGLSEHVRLRWSIDHPLTGEEEKHVSSSRYN